MGTMSIWDKLVEMFEESVIIQSVVTLILLVTICAWYMIQLWRGTEIIEYPNVLAALTGTVVGFWFKSKSELLLRKALREFQGQHTGIS